MTGRNGIATLLVIGALLATLLFIRFRGGEWNPGLIALVILVAGNLVRLQRQRSRS